MKFTRTARVLMPFILSIILVCVYIYTIPYWHSNVSSKTFFIKVLSLLTISVVTLTLSLIIRGYVNISLTVISYGILGTGIISYFSYIEISRNIQSNNDLIIPLALLLIPVAILPELYARSSLRRMASGCIGGKRLEDYSRSPWSFVKEKEKRLLSILYFDTPELNNLAGKIESETLKKIMNHILSKSIKISTQHNGIFVRHTEDSVLIAFEPSDSTYKCVLCGMELKQMVEEMKAMMGPNSDVKNLCGRVVLATDDGLVLQNIRRGTMELSIFSNAIHTLGELIQLSDGTDIIIDIRTHELCAEYFLTKAMNNKAHLVLGISGYYK